MVTARLIGGGCAGFVRRQYAIKQNQLVPQQNTCGGCAANDASPDALAPEVRRRINPTLPPPSSSAHPFHVCFLVPSCLRSTTQLDETEIYALLIAAAAHDFRHPGRTNAFLANTAHDIAITYCEDSSLERMHAGETLKLLSQTRYNSLPRRTAATNDGEAGIATRQTARKVIVKGILSTDLTRSWQYITDFKTHVMPIVEDPDGSEAIAFETNSMARIALTTFLLKCADVSHPVRPLRLHLLWSERILAEFHSQGHEENARGLAISPLCDQAKDEDNSCHHG